jgi:AcrR family transcriptional regulator
VNLRDRKKARTRQALGDAAVLLFLERGPEATTVEEIAAASGVSRRTFFRYFPSKEAAFFAAQHDRFDAFVRAVEQARGTEGAWGAARGALVELASRYVSDRRGSLAWHAAVDASPTLRAQDAVWGRRWESRLRDALVADGLPTLDAAIRAGATMGSVRGALTDWVAEDGRADLVSSVRRALDWLDHAWRG